MRPIISNNIQSLSLQYIEECLYTRGLSKSTVLSYQEAINYFLRIVPEIEMVEDISVYIINEFFKRIKTRTRTVGINTEKKGLKPSTVLTYYTRLSTFFKWLETHEYLEFGSITSKLRKPIRPNYDDEKSLSKNEISQIISAITLRNIDNEFLRRRDLLIINMFLYTGIRKGELLGILISDIDFESKQLKIRGANSKSKRTRIIPLHPKIIIQLKNYIIYRKKRRLYLDNLFITEKNKAYSSHAIKHWVKRYVEESGINFHLHRFRHTFACTMAQNGADIISIKNMLGHSTTKMTERYLRSIKSEHSRSHIESLSF